MKKKEDGEEEQQKKMMTMTIIARLRRSLFGFFFFSSTNPSLLTQKIPVHLILHIAHFEQLHHKGASPLSRYWYLPSLRHDWSYYRILYNFKAGPVSLKRENLD